MSDLKALDDFDMLAPEFQAESYAFLERVQRERPVYRMPQTGIYVVTRADDLRKVALDTETFTSRTPYAPLQGDRWSIYEEVLATQGWALDRTLNKQDPPAHRRSRKYLDALLNGREVQALAPRIQEVADELVDAFIDRGECEFVSEFAHRLPSIIISEQFGFDRADLPRFQRWATALSRSTNEVLTDQELRELALEEVEMQQYFHARLEERRAAPRGDFLTRILTENTAETVEGDPLSPGEIHNVIRFIIAGGFGTVINMMATAMYLLVSNPGETRKLRARPELVNNFVEEALRLETPVQILTRMTTHQVELGGATIPAGSIVALHFGAANHDSSKFVCPHAFDIERDNSSKHLSFNTGPHICPGRLLARQELQIAYATLLRRLGNIELSHALPTSPFVASWRHRRIETLPIRFTKTVGA